MSVLNSENITAGESPRTRILITFPEYTVQAGVPLTVKPVEDAVALTREVLQQLDGGDTTGPRPVLKLATREVQALKQLSTVLPIHIQRLVDPELPAPTEWVFQASQLDQVSVREVQKPGPADGSGHVAAAHRTVRERISDAMEYAQLTAERERTPAAVSSLGTGLPEGEVPE